MSTLVIDYLESPYGALPVTSVQTGVDLVVFLTAAVAISAFSNSLRRARTRAELASAEAQARRDQAELLADFGRLLGTSLECGVVLETIIRFVVPRLAEWCAVDLRTPDGALTRAIASHPESPTDSDRVVERVLRTGRADECGGLLCVPLPGRPSPLGALTLAGHLGVGRTDHRQLVREIAARAAAAIDNARLYQLAQQAREQRERAADGMSQLNRVAGVLAEGMTLHQVSNLLLLEAMASTGARGGRIHVVEPEDGRLSQVAAVGMARTSPSGDTMSSSGASTRSIDLTLNGRSVGCLELLMVDPPARENEKANDLLCAIARQGAQAVERARLYDSERRTRAEAESANAALRAVQSVTDAALGHLDLDDLLQELLARVRDLLHVDLAAVLIVSDDAQDLVECASVGVLASASRGARVPIGLGISGRIAHTREPLVVDNLCDADVVSPVLRESGVSSFLGVPLVADGSLVGVLHVDSIAGRHFTPEDTQLLGVVAERLALAINQARLYAAERSARAEAERLAAERAAVLAQIADGVVIAGAAGEVSFVNEAASQFFGARDVSHDALALGSPRVPDEIVAGSLRQALDGPSTVIDLEVHGAQQRIALGRAVPVQGESGARIGAVLTLRDVTAERTLEARKDEFFSNVSHDLRTPLATIKGAVEVVLQNEPAGVPDPLHRMLQIIDDEADRMSGLVDNLLELSRVRAGHVVLQRERSDLRTLVDRVARSIEPLAAASNQQLLIDMPSTPVEADVDVSRLERALQNLLANAQKYGREGGAIAVRVKADAESAQIGVSDNGPGIPAEDLERVFDRFYRSRDAGTRKIQGSGLGLPIARAFVELHGGTLRVESRAHEGSTFTIVLPHTNVSGDAQDEDSDRR
jgi:K+-sensing histidine kinase KdpD